MASPTISLGKESRAKELATESTFVILVSELMEVSPSLSPTLLRMSMYWIG